METSARRPTSRGSRTALAILVEECEVVRHQQELLGGDRRKGIEDSYHLPIFDGFLNRGGDSAGDIAIDLRDEAEHVRVLAEGGLAAADGIDDFGRLGESLAAGFVEQLRQEVGAFGAGCHTKRPRDRAAEGAEFFLDGEFNPVAPFHRALLAK